MDPFVYQALLSLNNAGALLLQRNCYEEAYFTLMDASRILKTSSIATGANERRTAHQHILDSMVARAAMRLEVSNGNMDARKASTLVALSGNIGKEWGVSSAEQHVLKQESIYLNYQTLEPSSTYIGTASAVVIYNFGLCHLKMALFNDRERDYFRDAGTCLLKLAFTGLPPLPEFAREEDFTLVATMSVITLSFLINACTLSNDESITFREQLRLAKEGLDVFSARARVAPAA